MFDQIQLLFIYATLFKHILVICKQLLIKISEFVPQVWGVPGQLNEALQNILHTVVKKLSLSKRVKQTNRTSEYGSGNR